MVHQIRHRLEACVTLFLQPQAGGDSQSKVAFDVPGERMVQRKAAARDVGCHPRASRLLINCRPHLLPADNVAVPQHIEEFGRGQHEHIIKQYPTLAKVDAKRMHRRWRKLPA